MNDSSRAALIRSAFFVSLAVVSVHAEPSYRVIGVASAQGSFRVNGTEVLGNMNLVSGMLLETQKSSTELLMKDGDRLLLDTSSRAKAFEGRLLLEAGRCQVRQGRAFSIDAKDFRIESNGPQSDVLVSVQGPKQIAVAALSGGARVFNRDGFLVANLLPGNPLTFEQLARPDTMSQISGTVRSQGDRYLLKEETTNVLYELKGAALAPRLGERIEAAGTVQSTQTGPVFTIASLLSPPASAAHSALQIGQTPGLSKLVIAVLDGEGAMNNIRSRVTREPIVRVEDENHRPVSGALVTFTYPSAGPGVATLASAAVETITTDSKGIAKSHRLKTNGEAGQYEILVAAAYKGLTAQTVIHQTISATAVSVASGAGTATGLSNTTAIILGSAVAAASAGTAGGIVASNNSSSSTSP